jgi:glycosyltransferase involved in cell wall biosynthesis
MIKVLHIIKSLGRGGAEMLLQETLPYHDKSKFEFHYIYFLPWKDQMVEGIRNHGGVVHNFPAKNNIAIMLQANKIARYVKENQIQLIHCHLPWAGFVGRIVYRKTKVPVVYSEHNKQERYRLPTKLLNRFTYNWQTAAVAVSADVASSIQQHIHPQIPVHTILNGVDVDSFVRDKQSGMDIRKQSGIDEQAIVVGTIAVFRFQKRLKEWITVFKEVSQKYPQLRGIIVGDGILKEEIMAHLKSEGMEQKIVMPGLQTAVKPWLSTMDIFMMSSVFEGLPIALLEAMSMECAVVSTDAGGVKEVIRNKQDGLLVSVDEWPQLTNVLSSLIEQPEQIQQFGKAARQRIVEAFSMKNMVQQTEELYESILKK